MKVHNVIGLRESLEQLQTEELQEMLQAELERDTPDPDSVRLILHILEEMESKTPSQQAVGKEVAWRKYQKKVAGLKKSPRRWNMLARVASVALIIGVLFTVIPGQANAETFWEMMQRWSTSIVEFFSKKDAFLEAEYSFSTDNRGLQQVYDAVVELGVTEPIVPMWLPDEYNLRELTVNRTPLSQWVLARFSNQESAIIYKVSLYNGEPAHQYYRDDTYYETYEQNGAKYNITRNNSRWVALWTKDNIECSITIDCQEDTLRRILDSIYVMEDS